MKVLSFLEFFNLTPKEKRDYLSELGLISINDYKTRYDYGDEVAELTFLSLYHNEVSVPFKPDMITEKFEGWKLNVIDGIEQLICDKPFFIVELYKKYTAYIVLDSYNCTDTTRTYLVRTLDDFINDCERAGIELQPKFQRQRI